MLAALLQNNNNARQQAGFKVDPRSSAGRSRPTPIDSEPGLNAPSVLSVPSYDIADILAAAAIFPEIAHEDPVARAIRRLRWISEALPFIKETREKRETAAFVAGVQLGAATVRAELEAAEKLSLAQQIKIIDEVRGTTRAPVAAPASKSVPVAHGRGTTNGLGGAVIVLGLVLGGVVIGSRISDARRKRR